MTNVPMISLKAHRYGRDDLKKNDPFDARPCDVSLLTALGRAMEAKDDGKSSAPPKPAQAARQTAAKKKQPAKGKYNRRDMRAKG